MFVQLPNFITLLRIALVPVIVVLLDAREYPFALMIFTLAGISDGVDGWIAKKYKLKSALGAILDPLADKLLLVSTYAMLAMLGDIPFWLLVLVVFRDVLIIGGYLVLLAMDKRVQIRPIWMSKINTFLQIMLVVLVLVHRSEWLNLDGAIYSTIVLVVITTLSSGMSYIRSGVKQASVEG